MWLLNGGLILARCQLAPIRFRLAYLLGPLEPRRVVTNENAARWEVRIPTKLRKWEGGTRRFFVDEVTKPTLQAGINP